MAQDLGEPVEQVRDRLAGNPVWRLLLIDSIRGIDPKHEPIAHIFYLRSVIPHHFRNALDEDIHEYFDCPVWIEAPLIKRGAGAAVRTILEYAKKDLLASQR